MYWESKGEVTDDYRSLDVKNGGRRKGRLNRYLNDGVIRRILDSIVYPTISDDLLTWSTKLGRTIFVDGKQRLEVFV